MLTKNKRWIIVAVAILALAALAWGALAHVLTGVLEGDALRRRISGRTAREIGGKAGYLPLSWRGLSVYCEGFVGRAAPPRALSGIYAHDIHARCNLFELWRGKWRINPLTVKHLQIAYGPIASQLLKKDEFAAPELMPASQDESLFKADIRHVSVEKMDLAWADPNKDGGEFRGVRTTFAPEGKNLRIAGGGGTFHQAKCPETRIHSFHLFYEKPALRIDDGLLELGDKGLIRVSGGFRFEEKAAMHLVLDFQDCPVTSFLSREQAEKVHGNLFGDSHLDKESPAASVVAFGTLWLKDGSVGHLAALEKLAVFTGRRDVNSLSLQKVSASYHWQQGRLEIKEFAMESKGVLSAQGHCSIKNQELDGSVRLGVAPDIVAKFPGAREEVFRESADGYLWTDVKVSGSISHPQNDLQERLVKAVENHFAKGLLVPLLATPKNALEVIEALFAF